eukprot:TRINITY_DN108716_c0_g1_i1.p1 TRINITY_DN108716_c0_g1~~TRINITY_DN108716_c0_g1_i1.p1  ORF type:complete len:263 (-),score=55.18 TRINITY_DN108716_c0_g1_i1:61-849(-)
MAKTIHWSPSEASLGRASRNSYLTGAQQHKLDVTEEMMKAATIGRSSEIHGYEPPGMVSRKIAALLTDGGRRADDNSVQVKEMVKETQSALSQVPEPVPGSPPKYMQAPLPMDPSRLRHVSSAKPRLENSGSSPALLLQQARPKADWQSMYPRKMGERRPSGALAAAGAMALGPEGQEDAQPESPHAPSGADGATATVHWVPKESSLARDSFNAMSKRSNLDVTEVMMRNAMMSKAAMMGPGWDPPGITSRKIAEVLTKKPS